MDEFEDRDVNQWSFPEVNQTPDEPMVMEKPTLEVPEKSLESKSDTHQNDNAIAREQLELLKSEYEKKITLLNNLMIRFKNPASVIDEEIIEIIESIIKKITMNIIRKEIAADPKILHSLIEELRGLIDSHGKIVKVYLSAADYQRLDMDKSQLPVTIEVNPKLAEGDIVIKSEFNEIRALLDERIDQVIRIKHE